MSECGVFLKSKRAPSGRLLWTLPRYFCLDEGVFALPQVTVRIASSDHRAIAGQSQRDEVSATQAERLKNIFISAYYRQQLIAHLQGV